MAIPTIMVITHSIILGVMAMTTLHLNEVPVFIVVVQH